jgi:hypothetical protein
MPRKSLGQISPREAQVKLRSTNGHAEQNGNAHVYQNGDSNLRHGEAVDDVA